MEKVRRRRCEKERRGRECTSSPVAMAARPTPKHAPCCTTSLVPLFLRASVR